MSPVSRRRKPKSRSVRRGAPLVVVDEPEECDCPYCAGDQPTPEQLDSLMPLVDLDAMQDPTEIEVAAAMFLAVGALVGEDFDRALPELFVPTLETTATASARAMLAGIAAICDGDTSCLAAQAAGRLAEAGVDAPAWLAELEIPVVAQECRQFLNPMGETFLLAGMFQRAGRSLAVFVVVDPLDCGAAQEILLIDPDQWDAARRSLRSDLRAGGVSIRDERIQPADFRRAVQEALEVRADHDHDRDVDDLLDDEDGPGYPAFALLLRSWLRALPEPASLPRHRHDGELDIASISALLDRIPGRGRRGAVPGPRTAKLPPRRKKSAGPAPIYRIKVGLRGARPPIWRRLDVPGDVTLARLHTLIQVAFDWDDSHLHVFETPYGSFGRPDAELAHRAESRVTLEQVATAVNDKLHYTYDFGDSWEHDILVEQILDRDPAVTYPRCVGGRRAAPPEDCGGVWGYAELVDILADPTHPEHQDRRDWLGLTESTPFDPAHFDAKAITAALQRLR
ncbi:hypothetical protein C1A38_00500 [Verrucosispora sp. ts21]|uniref:plasmid pRiA4b ORF-3 family protein n=1 Tax=Verrucosispora sp. ts21 TaxID=2069341 RepID=UPI000C88DE6F|nr:plasmid pRiA4b ORF-3 family protein [Verrucosispora sp. ts21]PMR63099.1 hypothetical protein C1A38_00500 [Verrucosispora sp. ts21]